MGKKFQSAKTLDMSNLSGIVDYKPEELYITVKAGTPIKIIVDELKKNNQHLAFEPTNFSEICPWVTLRSGGFIIKLSY